MFFTFFTFFNVFIRFLRFFTFLRFFLRFFNVFLRFFNAFYVFNVFFRHPVALPVMYGMVSYDILWLHCMVLHAFAILASARGLCLARRLYTSYLNMYDRKICKDLITQKWQRCKKTASMARVLVRFFTNCVNFWQLCTHINCSA